jgi:hypothetical protein
MLIGRMEQARLTADSKRKGKPKACLTLWVVVPNQGKGLVGADCAGPPVCACSVRRVRVCEHA